MKLKQIFSLSLIFVFILSLLCACGEKQETAPAPETSAPAAAVTEKEPLDSGDLLDIIFNDLGVSLSQASEINVALVQPDESREISFKLNGQDCSYIMNAYTGEIISKTIPEGAIEAAQDAGDPSERAINAAFDAVPGGYHGGAEDIHLKQSNGQYIVEFDYNGEHYTFTYDIEAGKIVQ